jgi:hypothetical protein
MKKVLKIILYLVVSVVVIVSAVIGYVSIFLPNIGVDDNLSVEVTPERVERGKYLANTVMGCMDCHAERDKSLFAMPIYEETRGLGGTLWGHKLGFPGEIYSVNITPYRLQDWTDGELFRAITAGVSKDGTALFPLMPYLMYGKLPKEDIYDVIAYLRSLKPVRKDQKPRTLDFPLSLIVNLMPKEGTHDLGPSPDPIKQGEYMITSAVCYDCHTPMKDGQYVEELGFAGGFEFPLETGGVVRSSNITPDAETGIGNWTREAFIAKFTSFQDSIFTPHSIQPGQFNTEMPWTYYANMNEDELGAIYDYLMSLEPISNKVERFTAP